MTGSSAERCDQVRELIPELAMGVAPGEQRAEALAHLASCSDCRTVLELTTDLVDELMLLAPEHEPPAGFEARVLAAIDPVRPLLRRRTTWLAAAAVVLASLGTAVVTRHADSDDRRLAAQYRQTLQVADGSYLRAAELVDVSGRSAGYVFAYQGKPSWVFMTVEAAPSGDYDVRVVTDDGTVRRIGECWVRSGRGSWGAAVDVPIYSLDRIEMVRGDGTTLSASFRS